MFPKLRRRAAVVCLIAGFVVIRNPLALESLAIAAPAPKLTVSEQAAAILAEIQLPMLQAVSPDLNPRKLAEDPAFTAEKLKDYADDGPTFEEIRSEPDKYFGQYPLRVAVVDAVVEIRKFDKDLPDTFRDPVSDATLKEITDKHQRTLAERQGTLEELRDKFEEVAKKRKQEKSKRWQAHFDYVQAQIGLRTAWLFEYNLALGQVKTQKLPPLDDKLKQNGWRLRAADKMLAPVEIRTSAGEAKKRLAQIANDYPGTPWAVLADKQKDMFLGLEWAPVEIGDK